MLTPEHPLDERLSALASGDPEVTDDTSLTEQLSSCARCTESVAELSALRASLAELPDLRPHRPLRLLPEVTDAPSRADRLGGWARRFFAPALAAGAALAMVGLVGTASPVVNQFSNAGAELADGPQEMALEDADTEAQFSRSIEPTEDGGAAGGFAPASGETEREVLAAGEDDERVGSADDSAGDPSPAERSPWPIVLLSGVAIMVAAALLRWVLVPRAG